MFGEGQGENNQRIGYEVFLHDCADLVHALDPERYYHPSSPMGGSYPNDAMGGDTHSYSGGLHVNGLDYPVFISENAYTCAPPLRSMRRFMREEEIYPPGYVNHLPHGTPNPRLELTRNSFGFRYWRTLPLPQTWYPFMDEFAHCEYWGVQNYYDATDAESLAYRFSASSADFFKGYVERARRGRPTVDGAGERLTQGHLSWKFNDAFAMISFSSVDYFLEPTRVYHSLKNVYQPVLVSIEIGDHIRLWGVNDTRHDITGKLVFRSFSRFENRVVHSFALPVFLGAGQSRVFTSLDHLGPIVRECVLYCALEDDESGEILAQNTECFDIERDSWFPEAKVALSWENGELTVTTDQYAHCVELTGNEDGDEFGWRFSDNYFHLLPFEHKVVRIGGEHSRGRITAKPYYSPYSTEIDVTI